MTPDPQKIAAGLQELVKFLATHPKLRDRAARQRLTFNEFFAELQQREAALGVRPEDVEPVREDPEVARWEEQVSMELDALGLVEEEQHLDLPLDFRAMPEYRAMLDAENAWIDQNGGYVRAEDVPKLLEIVRQHAPARGA